MAEEPKDWPWPISDIPLDPALFGEGLSDDEIREMGYEPTENGWVPLLVWRKRVDGSS